MESEKFEELSRILRGVVVNKKHECESLYLWKSALVCIEFPREKLSLRWIALWFRKIYCQSSLSRGRRSFVPKERLVHSIHLCGWRSSRGNEWLWRRVPFPTNCGSSWWLRIEINASPGNKEDYFNRKQYYSINLKGIFNPQEHYQLSWKYLRCKGFIAC